MRFGACCYIQVLEFKKIISKLPQSASLGTSILLRKPQRTRYAVTAAFHLLHLHQKLFFMVVPAPLITKSQDPRNSPLLFST